MAASAWRIPARSKFAVDTEREAATGSLSGVAYDSTNNFLLVAASANNVEVLNPYTFQPVGQLFIPNLAYALSAVVIGNIAIGNIAASPDGTVYFGNGSDVVVFDPASPSMTATFPVFSNAP